MRTKEFLMERNKRIYYEYTKTGISASQLGKKYGLGIDSIFKIVKRMKEADPDVEVDITPPPPKPQPIKPVKTETKLSSWFDEEYNIPPKNYKESSKDNIKVVKYDDISYNPYNPYNEIHNSTPTHTHSRTANRQKLREILKIIEQDTNQHLTEMS